VYRVRVAGIDLPGKPRGRTRYTCFYLNFLSTDIPSFPTVFTGIALNVEKFDTTFLTT